MAFWGDMNERARKSALNHGKNVKMYQPVAKLHLYHPIAFFYKFGLCICITISVMLVHFPKFQFQFFILLGKFLI